MAQKYAEIPQTDLTVSRINLGGNVFGWTADEATSFDVLDAFTAGGGTFIDTSDSYLGPVGGVSETIIGKWLAARGNRDDIVIATKVGRKPDHWGLAPANIADAIDKTLERLQTDYVDLYYAHFDDDITPIEEIAAAFDATVKAGKVRHVAISNLSPARQRDWILTARRENLAVPVAIQPQYSLVYRKDYEGDSQHPGTGYRAVAQEFNLAVFPYWSLAAGLLTGKYASVADFDGAARSHSLKGYATPEAFAIVDKVKEIAADAGVQPASVALAWLLAKGVTAPIASASKVAQVAPLLAALEFDLDAEAVAALDELSTSFA